MFNSAIFKEKRNIKFYSFMKTERWSVGGGGYFMIIQINGE